MPLGFWIALGAWVYLVLLLLMFCWELTPPDTPDLPRPVELYGPSTTATFTEANAKAKSLLLGHLSKDQQRQFKMNYTFEVTSNLGNGFIITSSLVYGVHQVDGARWRYCAFPPGVPIYDVMLAQKLMIETDEAAFRTVAHRGPPVA